MPTKKMLVLGFDGFDPKLARRWMDEGRLPHLKKLAERGTFGELGTSNPPQSPVAWSCLISGGNPGHHDVFDFIMRNPETYLPEIGMTETKKTGLKDLFAGLSGPSVETRRKGDAFWDLLGRSGIKSIVLRMPVTFPAAPLQGRLLSGMGTPDIRGTQGVYSYFTTSGKPDPESRGRIIPVRWNGSTIETVLTGPRVQGLTGVKDATVPVKIERLSNSSVRLTVGETKTDLVAGQWSSWIRVRFKANLVNDIFGICRFHLNSLNPSLELYATAVNIDPEAPAMPISYPPGYAKELFDHLGDYYTQGMPYDTWALNEGRLSEQQFLEQAYSILDENLGMMRLELNRFDGGLMFCYFGVPDLISHMFWRYIDPKHPKRGLSDDPQIKNAIQNIYERMDQVVGEAMEKAGPDTAILVLSDHGFGSFRRAVNVNSWLRQEGYLTLKDNETVGQEFFSNVDWSNTRAYSVGFGGIYVNQFGREKNGTVYKGAETDALVTELVEKLSHLEDADGTSIVKKVYTRKELYQGPYVGDGPDLFIGFNANYRASWQTGLGAAPKNVVEDNDRLWSGDHLCDPSLVPGVIFSNLKLNVSQATLLDVAPTILRYFDIQPPSDAEGKPLNSK